MTITHSGQFLVAPSSRMLSALAAFVRRAREHSQQLRSLKQDRAAFMNLVHQDDRILDDIGVTREEVLWAASLPVRINAALALHERAQMRRRAGG